jgi:acetyl-CoA synthetase
MILELPIAMLACARIGAPHAVIFAGFSAASVSERLIQANARVVVTADAFARGTKIVRLKELADEAVRICQEQGHVIETMLVVEHMKRVTMDQKVKECKWNGIDCKWDEEMEKW